jgi:hypothetical protein
MKTRIAIVAVLLALSAGWCFSACIQWDVKKRPPVSIAEGYDQAVKALGKDSAQFHCIGADIECSNWVYTFSSSGPESRWVIVSFNGAVKVQDHPQTAWD